MKKHVNAGVCEKVALNHRPVALVVVSVVGGGGVWAALFAPVAWASLMTSPLLSVDVLREGQTADPIAALITIQSPSLLPGLPSGQTL